MPSLHTTLAALPLLAFGSAAASTPERRFFRWNAPRDVSEATGLLRRQTPPPGYHPEFGSCGSGTTCENACGTNWILCPARTDLSLFCYNKVDLGQTCCPNGSGRACERGYYCAWQTFGGRVWCCEEGQSLEDCGVPPDATTAISSSSTTATPSTPTGSSGDPITTPTSATATGPDGDGSGSTCPLSTVTAWSTVTETAVTTISVAAVTLTVTETLFADGCSGPDTSAPAWTDTTVSGSFSITVPPTWTPTSFWPSNGNFTRTLVTAGAPGMVPSTVGIVVGAAALLLNWL
ncbi:hypothetical protein VTJ83DRAFT_5189 [Remersonia thermophila]|uniref:Uncharacterized protein n=1 Tax=Remersonia thermophila TaxID=72144 RepID=A0ABR4DCB0_9PEZI